MSDKNLRVVLSVSCYGLALVGAVVAGIITAENIGELAWLDRRYYSAAYAFFISLAVVWLAQGFCLYLLKEKDIAIAVAVGGLAAIGGFLVFYLIVALAEQAPLSTVVGAVLAGLILVALSVASVFVFPWPETYIEKALSKLRRSLQTLRWLQDDILRVCDTWYSQNLLKQQNLEIEGMLNRIERFRSDPIMKMGYEAAVKLLGDAEKAYKKSQNSCINLQDTLEKEIALLLKETKGSESEKVWGNLLKSALPDKRKRRILQRISQKTNRVKGEGDV